MARAQRLPVHEDLAAGRAPLAGEDLEELVLALRLRARRRRGSRRGGARSETPLTSADREVAHLERGRPDVVGDRGSTSRASRVRPPAAARATSGPSMCSTIFVLAALLRHERRRRRARRGGRSRGRSARSPRARRWVMKSDRAARSRSAPRITAKTRSARSDGSAAVISSRISSCGSRASARARSSIRSIGSGTSPACSVKSTSRLELARAGVARADDRRARQAQVLGDRQVGHERGILEDRREPDARRLRPASRRAPAFPSTAIVPPSGRITPVSILTSVLLPAPFAPSSACTSPGSTTRLAEAQRDDRPVRFDSSRASSERGSSETGARRDAPQRAPPVGRGRAYGPLQPTSCAAVYVVHGLTNSWSCTSAAAWRVVAA